MVHGSKDHSCNSNDGSFFASAYADSFVLESIVRELVRFHGREGDLHQRRFEVYAST